MLIPTQQRDLDSGSRQSGARGEWDPPDVTHQKQLPSSATLPADEALAAAKVFTFGRTGGAVAWAPSPMGDAMAWRALLLAKPQSPALTLCSHFREIVHDEFKLKVKSQHKLESQ